MIGTLVRLIQKMRKKSSPAYQTGWAEQSPSVQVYSWSNAGTNLSATANVVSPMYDSVSTKPMEEDNRIVKKPVEVVSEILTEKPRLSVDDIDKQIKIVERRIRILREQKISPSDELMAMSFLKARQKYKKYGHLFGWEVTTNKMIEELCKKYKLRTANLHGYYKCVPTEALDELEKFTEAWKKVRKDEPQIQLIVDVGGPETRRDPILLASAPWGRFWYVLGAWDREIEVLGELIYCEE